MAFTDRDPCPLPFFPSLLLSYDLSPLAEKIDQSSYALKGKQNITKLVTKYSSIITSMNL